jgi:Fe-S-cluster containining protein
MDLEIILEEAGEATSAPLEPKGGIPKQWFPRFLRVPIRWIILPFVLLDLWTQKLAKKIIRPPFVQKGGCKRRGNCCHYIMIEEGKGLFGRLYHFWNTQINGFYPREKELHIYEGKRVHVMGCRYLKKDGSCGNYRLRPLVCRKWPVIEHFGHPRILKGCGFYAEPRKQSHQNDETSIS